MVYCIHGRYVIIVPPILVYALFFVLPAASYCQSAKNSQGQGQIINLTTTSEVIVNNPVNIKADVKDFSNISQALLFYRNDETSDFQQVEMSFDESTMAFNGTVPGSYVVGNYIEVYVRITMRDGTAETYPEENPTDNPVRFAVNLSESQQDILVISPERNQRLTVDDLMIAASMLYAPDFVDRKKTEMYFDGVNVTVDAVISGDVIVYSPSKFPMPIAGGIHTAKIVLNKNDGSLYRSLAWNFFILSPSGERASEQRFTYRGNAQVELSNENIGGASTWYNRGDFNFDGNGSGIGLGANLHLTSEEKSYRQPQDRYGLYANTSWLNLKFGDSYPTFSPLIMNGMRVRGVSGKLSVGFFNLEAADGQTLRGIEGQYLDTVHISEGSASQITGPNYLRLNDSTFVNVNYGTYSRNLFVIRPSFNFGSHAQLGFTYLKSFDNVGSIAIGNDSVGNYPNENMVLGSDFSMNFDEHRINFVAEAAISMLNQNTAAGNLSADSLDSISHSDAGTQINNIIPLSTIENFITINQFLVPLDPTKLSSLAWDANLSLNYFNAFAKIGYIYRGPDYTSFGQPFLTTDVRGMNFLVRPRLMNNQVMLSFSYEDLFDNLQKNKFATTQYANSNFSASYFPMTNLPNFTVGFSSNANSNSISPDSTYAVDNVTNRYYVESSYGFNYLARNNVSINFGISNRKDHVLLGTDLNNSNLAFLINSDFGELPLKTTIGFNINGNKNSQKVQDTTSQAIIEQIQTFNYTFITLGATYGLMENRLIVGANYTPTFGSFSRNTYAVTASYHVAKSQSINLNLNYYAVTGSNDFVGSLIYVVDF